MSQPNPQAEYQEDKATRLQSFKNIYGEDAEELFGSDWEEGIESVESCEHVCSGNCRRVGCNCDCGEFHLPAKI